jgi:predicted peptidase
MNQLVFIVACILNFSILFGQKVETHFRETTYPYYLYLPHDSILNNNPPVMVFLHGKSLSGSTLENLKKYGVMSEIIKGRHFPAIVIAPQTNNGWKPQSIKEVIDVVRTKYTTDSTRLYVIGMSMGGYGTINFTGTYPDLVAGAVAMCGGGDLHLAENLSKVPLWVRHGDKDYIVPINESQKIVNAIKKFSEKNLKFTIDKGLDHGDMARFFRGTEIYEWLFKLQKK